MTPGITPSEVVARFDVNPVAVVEAGRAALLGQLTEMLAKRGVSQLRFYQAGMLLCAASFAPIALGAASGTLLWLVLFAATSIAAITAYALLTQLVPAAQTGRVTTSSNLLLFATSFVFQWGVGSLL